MAKTAAKTAVEVSDELAAALAKTDATLTKFADDAFDTSSKVKGGLTDADLKNVSLGKKAEYVESLSKKSGTLSDVEFENLKLISKDLKEVNTASAAQVAALSGATSTEAATALTAAKSWTEKNPALAKTILASGLTVGGIALLMILTKKGDPADALAAELAKVAKGAGGALGGGVHSFFDGSGISDFFTQYWWISAIMCCLIIVVAVYSAMK